MRIILDNQQNGVGFAQVFTIIGYGVDAVLWGQRLGQLKRRTNRSGSHFRDVDAG